MDKENKGNLINLITGLFIIHFVYTADNYYLQIAFYSLLVSSSILLILNLRPAGRIFKGRYALHVLIFIFLLLFIFQRYGLFLNRYIYHEDYPGMYLHNKIGIDCLKSGGVFGWSSYFLGGDVDIAYANGNLSFFCFPLIMLFGIKTGVNLLLMIAILAFPFLMYIVAGVYFENKDISKITLLLSTLFLLTLKTLFWGNFNCLVAMDMVVCDLIFYNLFVKNRRYSSFLLVLSMTLTLFAHPAFFVYAVILIFAFELLGFKKERFVKSCLLLLFIVLATGHFIYFFANYHTWFIEDSRNFIPIQKDISLGCFLEALFQALQKVFNLIFNVTLRPRYDLVALILLPLFFKLFKENMLRYLIVGIILCIFMIYVGDFYFEEFAERPIFLLPIFLSLMLSYCFYKYRTDHQVLFSLLFVFFAIFIYRGNFVRLKTIEKYSPELTAEISKLEGNLILLEQRGHNNYLNKEEREGKRRWSELPPDNGHIESFVQLQTKKRFYGFFLEGYAHTVFRGNTVVCGTHKGKWIDNYDIQYFNREMTKWGIKYLVLWSRTCRGYFDNHREHYRLIWQGDEWHIYEFLNADTRSVVIETGEGDVFHNDGYRKTVKLNNVIKGKKVIIRSNYFPAWKAYFENKEIKLFDEDGQMAFYAPKSGDLKIELYFPKYEWLSIIAVSSLLCSFYLSYKRII